MDNVFRDLSDKLEKLFAEKSIVAVSFLQPAYTHSHLLKQQEIVFKKDKTTLHVISKRY